MILFNSKVADGNNHQLTEGFGQFVKLAKQLPKSQWAKLKTEVESQEQAEPSPDMLTFLMSAPAFKNNLTKSARHQ